MALQHYLVEAAVHYPDRVAIVEPEGKSVSYRYLDALTDRVRDRLIEKGVRPGDRVGVVLHKSIDSVACIYGILKAGAAYVPVDVTGPLPRAAYILNDCEVKLIFAENTLAEALQQEMQQLPCDARFIGLDAVGGGNALSAALDLEQEQKGAPAVPTHPSNPQDLAYILYTSGSTGKPKGVPLTHENGMAFVEWCSASFEPTEEDRFSAHAPFHFDLSILDLYTPIKHGAAIVLIGEEMGKEPARLAEVIEASQISIWYSAPSILTMLLQFGDIAAKDYSRLRTVLFAGEVFPVGHLKGLMATIPGPRYYNLYGPTETNVCTYEPVPEDFACSDQTSLPIGPVCEHLQALVVDAEGVPVSRGDTGELIICGSNVMAGYWNLPEQTAKAFFEQPEGRFYRTGDLVIEDEQSSFTYVGRRDRMIKKRGYRVELGEIEAKLHLHPEIIEAAVVAVSDDEGVKVHAHFVTDERQKLSTIKLKKFCSEHLPLYMVPDTFKLHPALPKTSTDKTDYQSLKKLHEV